MKLTIQYLSDGTGNIEAVQVPFKEWRKLMKRLRKYEQKLEMKPDLTEAFEEMETMKNSQ